ncbi:hypothetical protein OsI_38368 [Oryza sativa Indica Group]|uniref:Uncharacterized protein n=1 Tax=Oryza sativa subsp. indica TaxID=39946 RepID=B8BPQ5_ORYSI|nr:hypothetical protein OsI_38368 [Oryza sativa Indica Group]
MAAPWEAAVGGPASNVASGFGIGVRVGGMSASVNRAHQSTSTVVSGLFGWQASSPLSTSNPTVTVDWHGGRPRTQQAADK